MMSFRKQRITLINVFGYVQQLLEQYMQDIVEAIKTPSDYDQQFELLLQVIWNPSVKNTLKPQSGQLLEVLNQIVLDDDAPPYTRFACLLIVRDLFVRKYTVFISSLLSSKLLKTMTKLAKTIDPDKPIEKKGRSFFRDPDLGNKFIRLILESIQRWSQRFPLNSSQTPSKFKLSYNQLVKEKVVFPTTREYYVNDKKEIEKEKQKQKQKQKQRYSIQKTQEKKAPPTPKGNPDTSFDKRSAQELIKQSLSKIQGFIRFLDVCDQQEQLISEIQMYHRLFQSEAKKNETIAQKIISQQLLSEEMVGLFLFINQFYRNEDGSYSQFLTGNNSDLKSYIDQVKLDAVNCEPYFKDKQKSQPLKPKTSGPQINLVEEVDQRKTQQPKIQRKLTTENKSEIRNYDRDRQQNYNRNGGRQNNSTVRSRMQVSELAEVINERQLQQIAQQGKSELNQFWSHVNPTSGFGAIKRELQSQLGNRSKSRSKSRKALSRTKKLRGQNLSPYSPISTSKGKSRLFDMSSNVVVNNTQYSGIVIDYNNQYEVGSVNEHQGSKRLKKSNILNKGILFQNQLIQIGYKSEACYGKFSGHQVSLKLSLFYGNKSQSVITKFNVQFEGDDKSLLYRNPQYLPQQITPGHQIKQQLIIVPVRIPFSLLSLNIKYSVGRQFPDFTVYVPNSLLKYMVTHPVEIYKFSQAYKRNMDTELRTNIFSLSRDFDPSSLNIIFPQMIELTKVQDFLSQNTYNQLVLGLLVLVVDCDEYLVKINIRPNMTVVIQLVILNNSDDSESYAKFLLQSLQFLLQSS